MAYNYQGSALRPAASGFVGAGRDQPLAAELLSGNDDVRPRSADLLRRALAGLPAQVPAGPGSAPTRATSTAGWPAAVGAGLPTSRSRRSGTRRSAGLPGRPRSRVAGRPGHADAEVAASDYAPAGWPPGSYTMMRRVPCPPSRSPPTVGPGGGAPSPKSSSRWPSTAGSTWWTRSASSSPTCPPTTTDYLTAIEAWFRRRVDIEERIREAKLGAALRRLPSADVGLNTVWMWAALLAGLISVTLQSLARLDTATGRARTPARFQLLRVPGRAHSPRPRPDPAATTRAAVAGRGSSPAPCPAATGLTTGPVPTTRGSWSPTPGDHRDSSLPGPAHPPHQHQHGSASKIAQLAADLGQNQGEAGSHWGSCPPSNIGEKDPADAVTHPALGHIWPWAVHGREMAGSGMRGTPGYDDAPQTTRV